MTPQEQRLKQIESAELKARWSNYRGRSSQQLNADARNRRIAREAQLAREHRAFEKLIAETRECHKLMDAKLGRNRPQSRTPRLDAYHVKMAALFAGQKKPSRIPPAPQSRTPRLDYYHAKFKAMEDKMVRDGLLARVPSYGPDGRQDGVYTWSHDGKVKPRWIPNARAERELRLARLRAG